MRFDPLTNGLDFIYNSLEHLQGAPDPRSAKYAALHLWAGIEILLKERLCREHWTLVFDDPAKATKEDYESGRFRSVSYSECLSRLAGIVSVDLSPSERKKLDSLQQKRNRLEHFGIVDTVEAVQGSASAALSVVLDVIIPELEPEKFVEGDRELLGEIRKLLGSIDMFIQKRWKLIREEVDAEPVVVACPDCMQKAAKPGDGLRCLFCGAEAGFDEVPKVALRYAEAVLGYCAYTTRKDGGESPVRECPNCDTEALVDHGPGGNQLPEDQYVCFACGEVWDEGELDECPGCARLCKLDEAAVCDHCIEYALSKD